jgi:murein DD-endopeptidase MepM/ murein hydrolase activator NlpD
VGDPTQNHQVLATGYDLDLDSGTLSIQIYDPNHPHKKTSLSLNVSDPRNGIQITQGTGEPLRGFFIIPHKPQKKLPKLFPERPRVEFGRDSLALPIRLRWPVDSGRVNQYFGENPKTYKPFGLPGHEGLDLFARSGANVYAAAEGEVYEAGFPKGHPYGRQIRIRHEFQNRVYSTVYAHLSEVFVQPGQRVAAGETIDWRIIQETPSGRTCT